MGLELFYPGWDRLRTRLAHSSEPKLKAVFGVYEHRLSKSRYLAGESYSPADLSHLTGIR
ncbi:hypothetical protein Ddye_012608 [Dipteronia dyeriana]|uniref:Glutathione S-transferase C-terminal domain-containing protein n=1 Tax=Dipteronia dyeriana TaxID=168575 RepID=A0AAE0CIT2_9ROSI|nr:hypothetical protein Ddye_012608 [Dipteronia dyeriana]